MTLAEKVDWLRANIDLRELYTQFTGITVFGHRADSPSGSRKAVAFRTVRDVDRFYDWSTGVSGDVVTIWVVYRKGGDPDDASARTDSIHEMYDAFHGADVPVSVPKRKTVTPRPEAADLSAEQKDAAYRILLDACILDEDTLAHLKGRGLSEEEIARYGFKTAPKDNGICPSITSALRAEGIDPDSVPGLYTLMGATTCSLTPVKDGVLIPIYSPSGLISGLQIRDNDPNAEIRYRWFSTPADKRGIKHAGKSSGSPVACFPGRDGFKTLLVTEGVFKALAFNRAYGAPVVAVQGVSCIRLIPESLRQLLTRYPIQRILIGYDADFISNMNVAGNAVQLFEAISEVDSTIKVNYLMWPKELGKGIDDALEKGRDAFASASKQMPMTQFKELFLTFAPVAKRMQAEGASKNAIGAAFAELLQK